MSFWGRFLSECDRRGLKPNPAGKEIGVSSATVTKWKNGAIPTSTVLSKVADYFGVSVEYLLGSTDTRTQLDEKLEGVDFALSGEIREMSNKEKQDLLDYILFKRKQKENRQE